MAETTVAPRILAIGNSFSVDTLEHVPRIAHSLGLRKYRFTNLYSGGCSLRRHYHNAVSDTAEYTCYSNVGRGWYTAGTLSIRQAVTARRWDVISLQHGTGDGSFYTDAHSYETLVPLVSWLRELVPSETKLAFNMAWVPEATYSHPDLARFDGDPDRMFEALASTTRHSVMAANAIDRLSPAGTAIQNARTRLPQSFHRDGFHLSYGLGRYVAGLTFLKAVWGCDLGAVTWRPEGVTEEGARVAVAAANAAVRQPYAVTPL